MPLSSFILPVLFLSERLLHWSSNSFCDLASLFSLFSLLSLDDSSVQPSRSAASLSPAVATQSWLPATLLSAPRLSCSCSSACAAAQLLACVTRLTTCLPLRLPTITPPQSLPEVPHHLLHLLRLGRPRSSHARPSSRTASIAASQAWNPSH